MAPELWNIEIEAAPDKQAGDFSSQARRIGLGLIRRIAEDVANFFFHAMAITTCAALKSRLYSVLNIADHELRHIRSSLL